MQTGTMKICSQITECSISAAKIHCLFVTTKLFMKKTT